jgi:hypothetical protein
MAQEIIERFEELTVYHFYDVFGHSEEACIHLLQEIGLIPWLNESHFICPRCNGNNLHLTRAPTYKLNFAFRCRDCKQAKRQGRQQMETWINPLHNTWFERAKLSFLDVMRVTHAFVLNFPIFILEDQTGIDDETLIDWYSVCREVCTEFATQRRIGGAGHIVEIDEHLLVTPKYHRGHALVNQAEWVWGAYDRTTGEIVLVRLPDRTDDTLLLCITNYINEHSLIFSDGWLRRRSNEIVDDLNMSGHHYVVHKYEFSRYEWIAQTGK